MELKVLENPDMELASGVLKLALTSKNLILIVGNCRVDYEGRASSRLEPGERVVIIKQDGAVLVHRPTGYSPVNWQPQSSIVEIAFKPGVGLIVHAVREEPREYLTIVFSSVSLIVTCRLVDEGDFTMYIEEREMRDMIAEDPSLIEEGLRVLAVEKPLGGGYVDIYAVDSNGKHVLVELKRTTATKEAVIQLYKYVEAYKAEHGVAPRGILVAPTFSPTALELAMRLGLECKHIDPRRLWTLLRLRRHRKTTLIDFYKGLRGNEAR